MATFNWTSGTNGADPAHPADWNTGTFWTPATVPTSADDVVIDAANTFYAVTIASGETETVHSLSMNNSVGRPGTNDAAGYHAAELILDGTLAFAPGSAGALDGPLQNYVFTDFGANAAIINGGTLNAFIQVEGTLTLTGTNAVYITNEIQALGGTVTIDTPIATMSGTTLFDGIFQAKGLGAVMNLGGVGNTVNITKMEGPAAPPQNNTTGWTEFTFADASSQINEWNGTAYVSIETSLTEISGGATLDVTFGRNYTTTNTLTIDHLGASVGAGMLNMQGVTVTTGGIDINGGIVQGYGTIASDVINDGTMIALGGTVGGTLDVAGNLSGTGVVLFDMNAQEGAADPTKGTLVLHGVSAGQTVVMNGGDTLELANPGAFAGTIAAGIGDKIVLDGLTATSATLNNGTLVVSNGGLVVASLVLSGNYTGDSITANGSVLTFGTAVAPGISGTAAGQALSDTGSVSPFANVTIQDSNVGQTETVTITLSATANGSLTNLGNGTYDPTTGVYTNVGSAAQVTADLHALLFTPTAHQVAPGQAVTTTFTISDTDTAALTASDATTTVIATAGTVAPVIAGTVAGQTTNDLTPITPFAGVTIGDLNAGQTETVTITLSAAANGTLSNLGNGTYDPTTGVYTDTGSAAAVTADLHALLFTPTAHQVPPGQAVTTSFTISDTDTAAQAANDSVTTVIATAINNLPTISGTVAGQTTTTQATVNPFAEVTIADQNAGQTETVTITLSAAANGTLDNLGGGTYDAATGVYIVTGSASAVTAAVDGLVFTPTPHQATAGGTVTTSFTIQDTDSAGAMAADTTTSVIASAPAPLVVNNTDGTSYLFTYDPTSSAIETIMQYSGPNNTGTQISTVVDNADGTSYLFAYNPTSTVSMTCQTWTATDASNGAPAGTMISDVVNNTDGTSAIYQYNPTSGVTLNVTKYSNFDAATGAPTGILISDVVDNADGTSILYAYNPTSAVTQTAVFYSATDPSNGAPAGTVTRVVFDYTAGGSSVTANGVTTYYNGVDGTGSVISAPIAGPTPISFTGSNQTIDPGAGNHTIQFIAGGTSDTLVLHLVGSDQVLGFNPAAGDTLDLSALLREASMTVSDVSQLSKYVTINNVNGSAQVLFDPTGQGGGSQVAMLVNDGGLVKQLQSFASFKV